MSVVCTILERRVLLPNQLGPKYEGQLMLMAEPIAHPKRPPRTPSRRSEQLSFQHLAATVIIHNFRANLKF